MRRIANIAILAASIAISPVIAYSQATTSIKECDWGHSYGPDQFYEANRDLGGGYVMYVWRVVDDGGGLIIVADCSSGSTLEVEYSKKQSRPFQRYIRKAAASPEKVTLPMLKEHFSSLGIWTGLRVQQTEHCACAAFYPETKGDKRDWHNRQGHP